MYGLRYVWHLLDFNIDNIIIIRIYKNYQYLFNYVFIYLFEIENEFKSGIYSIIILFVCMVWFIWFLPLCYYFFAYQIYKACMNDCS